MPILNEFETAMLLNQMMNDEEIDRLKTVGCTAFVQEADKNEQGKQEWMIFVQSR